MYVPTSEACNLPNGLDVPTEQLAAGAAGLAADNAAMVAAESAFASLLVRSPGDFACMGSGVVKDVAETNNATGVLRGGVTRILRGSDAVSDRAPVCDARTGGGVTLVPLNGPGSSSVPLTTARPAPLRTNQAGIPPLPAGLGRYARRAPRSRGMGQCCSDLPTWGDAFPAGGPVLSPIQSVLNWTANNPLLAVGLGLTALWIATGQTKGKRG